MLPGFRMRETPLRGLRTVQYAVQLDKGMGYRGKQLPCMEAYESMVASGVPRNACRYLLSSSKDRRCKTQALFTHFILAHPLKQRVWPMAVEPD